PPFRRFAPPRCELTQLTRKELTRMTTYMTRDYSIHLSKEQIQALLDLVNHPNFIIQGEPGDMDKILIVTSDSRTQPVVKARAFDATNVAALAIDHAVKNGLLTMSSGLTNRWYEPVWSIDLALFDSDTMNTLIQLAVFGEVLYDQELRASGE